MRRTDLIDADDNRNDLFIYDLVGDAAIPNICVMNGLSNNLTKIILLLTRCHLYTMKVIICYISKLREKGF